MLVPIISVALLLACASQPVLSQFVTPPTDLTSKAGYAGINVRYKSVPAGICEQNPKVKSYSGYADVAPNEHIFWWFFEARNQDPTTAPLTIWINGGPGTSSMLGLFQELGPCRINADGSAVDNPYSWSNASNMLFIDQPAQTGFSYSTPIPAYLDPVSGVPVELPSAKCPAKAADWDCGTYSSPVVALAENSTATAAPNMWKTLQGFMGAFPQYARHGVYFASIGYGGHWVPVYSEYFESQNSNKVPGAHNISLQGVLIGNGWFDPMVSSISFYNYTVNPGNTYGVSPFNASVQELMYNRLFGKGGCIDQTTECYKHGNNTVCNDADNFCYNNVESILSEYANRDLIDIRELLPDPFPPAYFESYLNTAKVQAAMGAYVNYTTTSNFVFNVFARTGDEGREIGDIEAMTKLLSQDIPVVMYYGDADYDCNWLGGEVVAQRVGAPGLGQAGYADISTSDNVVHGQVKQSGNYAFVRIYEAGQRVPFYQPLVSLQILERVLKGKDIATGMVTVGKNYKTSGPKLSTYMEGNATVQFKVLPPDSTYNTTTNGPNPP